MSPAKGPVLQGKAGSHQFFQMKKTLHLLKTWLPHLFVQMEISILKKNPMNLWLNAHKLIEISMYKQFNLHPYT